MKALNKWCDFHEDYGHLNDDFMSLKVRVDNHIQKGNLAKYRKEQPSITLPCTIRWYSLIYT